jgi:hypothetical protein
MMVTVLDNILSEKLARHDDTPSGGVHDFLCHPPPRASGILQGPRKYGAAAIQQSSYAQRIGATWWYVLQTHSKMDKFLEMGFKQHPYIAPVFTAHLDRYRVSRATFGGLETQVEKLKTWLTTLSTAVNRLNGARGNLNNCNVTLKATPGAVPG